MSGIFGVVAKDNCQQALFYGTDYHSHLGTQFAGLAVWSEGELLRKIHDIRGSQFKAKFLEDYKKMKGRMGIGVISAVDEQPICVHSKFGPFALVVNGFIENADKLAEQLYKEGQSFSEVTNGKVNQTELVAKLIIRGKDIVDGKCVIHKRELEFIEEENWFFRLSKYTKEIEKKIKSDELKIIPETKKNEILSLLKEGLEDVSFSRSKRHLEWGIPVPNDDSQVMYVWADALTNYISGYRLNAKASPDHSGSDLMGIKEWKKHPADVHMIGKDISRFHTAIWPGMLLSCGLPLPKNIFVHGFVTSGGEKMSKSIGNVIDPYELVKKYGTDPVRYYLLREIPSSEDGDFSYEKFEERYNGDLANGLGNFAARVSTLASKETDLVYKETDNDQKFLIKEHLTAELGGFLINGEKPKVDLRIDLALGAIMGLVNIGDGHMSAAKPWDKNIETKDKLRALSYLASILFDVGNLLRPFLPGTAEKILENIKVDGNKINITKKIDNLFPRI